MLVDVSAVEGAEGFVRGGGERGRLVARVLAAAWAGLVAPGMMVVTAGWSRIQRRARSDMVGAGETAAAGGKLELGLRAGETAAVGGKLKLGLRAGEIPAALPPKGGTPDPPEGGTPNVEDAGVAVRRGLRRLVSSTALGKWMPAKVSPTLKALPSRL